jgi:hypothetical protein
VSQRKKRMFAARGCSPSDPLNVLVRPQRVMSGMLKGCPDAGDGPVPALGSSPTGHLICSASATRMPAGPRR